MMYLLIQHWNGLRKHNLQITNSMSQVEKSPGVIPKVQILLLSVLGVEHHHNSIIRATHHHTTTSTYSKTISVV
jgi:hypothetical protein